MRGSGYFFRHQRVILSSSGGAFATSVRGGGGSWFKTPAIIDIAFCPRKARLPVTISYSNVPNEKISERGSTRLPWACSGDIYAAVPNTCPGLVFGASEVRGASSSGTGSV